jgi:hypothetical protein
LAVTAEPQRRLRLVDAIVLIAVEALALAMTRSYLRCFSALNHLVSTEPSNVRVMGTREWMYACVPHLVVLSAALWPLRIIGHVSRFRRIARLPGLTVSYAAWVGMVFAFVRSVFDLRIWLRNTYFPGVGVLSMGDIFVLRVVAMKDFIGSEAVGTPSPPGSTGSAGSSRSSGLPSGSHFGSTTSSGDSPAVPDR